ncbi:hypothetical protein CEP54_014543 [Fusarium duplospermum]|uniref:Uncharacterized protein n=1 Tax=Fusarium duplospermum TaxID=1325734 RepID=A0A428NVM6_9HYPO|nr:hypothetical protein CEP54_014543 [Fusarium duplospermum]
MTRLPVRTIGQSLGADYILGQGPCPGDPDIVSPIEEEQKILCILSAVDVMLDRCQLTAQNTNRVLLCWLASSRLDVYQPKPFALTIEETTQKRYRGLWKRFITFILRSYLLSDPIREQGVKIYLSEGIAGKLKSVWEHRVWQFINTTQHKWPRSRTFSRKRNKSKPHQSSCENSKVELFLRHRTPQHNDAGSPSDDEFDGDYDSSEDEYEEFEESESEDDLDDWTSDSTKQEDFNDSQLHDSDGHETRDGSTATSIDEFLELLFQLSFELSTEPFQNGHADSALLVYFSGVLGFSSDCRRFQLAREYCPYLSGLIWIQRLIFLEYALPLYPYPTIGIQQRPYMPMQRLNDVRQKYMVSGSLSPLAGLHSLRNFGQKVAKTEPPPFLLRWSDDGERVSYGDHFTLSMDEFRRLSDHFITRAEQLCDELMFGLEPNLDVSKIKDDLTNTQPVFSFVAHPDNMFEEIYKDLLVRVCTSRSGRLVRNGGWSAQAVMAYLRKVTALEENISGGLLTACGQSPRIRDLLSVAVENSPCAIRGIFVWNGSMAYSIRHHKAKRSTNQEFYVVRFLPARLAAVVLKHLVCIRRLAALLRREQFGFDGSNRSVTHKPLLFQSCGKAWSPTRVTRVLRMASKQAWNWEINARISRQLAIGITEKHVREVHSPFNRYDDRSIDADLNVAFAWQSGHRPLQRGITYGLDGAYPHQLQPSLLRAYEWASTRWHEFLHLVSKSSSFFGQELPATSIQHARSSSIQATAFIGRHGEAPATTSIKKRKRESLDELVPCGRKILNSSLTAPTRPTISIDGFAAILPEYYIKHD